MALFSVMTPHTWWTKELKALQKEQDRNGDWGIMADERAQGMRILKLMLLKYGEPKYWPQDIKFHEVEKNHMAQLQESVSSK